MADDQQDPDTYFKDKKTVTISEVAILLDEYVTKTRERDPEYQPNVLVTKTMEYAKAFAGNKNRDSVQSIRNLLAQEGLSDQELASICNLQVETADEARCLVPTLVGRFTDEDLNRLLAEVRQYREYN